MKIPLHCEACQADWQVDVEENARGVRVFPCPTPGCGWTKKMTFSKIGEAHKPQGKFAVHSRGSPEEED